jgi:hypothetical protein
MTFLGLTIDLSMKEHHVWGYHAVFFSWTSSIPVQVVLCVEMALQQPPSYFHIAWEWDDDVGL